MTQKDSRLCGPAMTLLQLLGVGLAVGKKNIDDTKTNCLATLFVFYFEETNKI
jgi:hypothetical protein